MALTVTRRSVESLGSKNAVVADITFDNNYPTGGEAIAAADLGLQAIDFMLVEQNESGKVITFDRANSKLMVFAGALAEAAAASDQSGTAVRVLAIG